MKRDPRSRDDRQARDIEIRDERERARAGADEARTAERRPGREERPGERREGGQGMTWREPRSISTEPEQWLTQPLSTMREFARELNRAFDGLRSSEGARWFMGWPAIEMLDRDGTLVVRAELPGMDRKDVRVRVVENQLILEGERRNDRESRREGWYQSEWSYGRFSRRVPLPVRVDPERIRARFQDGVLEVTLASDQPIGTDIPIEDASGEHSTSPRGEGRPTTRDDRPSESRGSRPGAATRGESPARGGSSRSTRR